MSLLSDSTIDFQRAYSVLSIEHNQAIQKIKGLEEENARLKEQLQLMQQRQFGKRSETQVGEPMGTAQLQSIAGYTRKKGKKTCGRTIDTSILPRHTVFHNLNDTHCSCGCPLKKIGEDVCEQLEVLPMRLYVIEHVRSKYSCTHCHTIKMAPKPKAPIPKGLAGGSLLTEIILNKYQYHLPLYRQSKILESYNACIPDNTLGNWIIQTGNDLMPLYDAFWEVILESSYLQADETPVKILKPEKNGYLWTYYSPHIGHGLVVFELSLTRSGVVAKERLSSFKGLLQTDGYAGYQNLRKRQGITGFGCMTHARRKFAEVLKITRNSDGLAVSVIEQLKPLYALEERMKQSNVTFHTRKRLRQKYAWPLLKSLHHWLKQKVPAVPPKSKLGEALSAPI
jgi:transposase